MKNLESKIKKALSKSIMGITLAASLSLPGCNQLDPDYRALKQRVKHDITTIDKKYDNFEIEDYIIEYKEAKTEKSKVCVAYSYSLLKYSDNYQVIRGCYIRYKDGWISWGSPYRPTSESQKIKYFKKFGINYKK